MKSEALDCESKTQSVTSLTNPEDAGEMKFLVYEIKKPKVFRMKHVVGFSRAQSMDFSKIILGYDQKYISE